MKQANLSRRGQRACAGALLLVGLAGLPALLSGCGGGGGGDAEASADPAADFSTQVPSRPTGTLSNTSATAQALIVAAEQGSITWANEQSASPTAFPTSETPSQAASLREGAARVDDISADACSAGSAQADAADELTRRIDRGGSFQAGDRIKLVLDGCVLLNDLLPGGGGLPHGSRATGSAVLSFLRWNSPADLLAVVTYRDFRVQLPSGRVLSRPSARVTVDLSGGQANSYFDTTRQAFIQHGPSGAGSPISVTGNLVSVQQGTLRTRVDAAGGYLDATYTGWNFDAALRIGLSGTVRFVDQVGTAAEVIATNGSGAYRVTIGFGATATTYACSSRSACFSVALQPV